MMRVATIPATLMVLEIEGLCDLSARPCHTYAVAFCINCSGVNDFFSGASAIRMCAVCGAVQLLQTVLNLKVLQLWLWQQSARD